MNRVYSIALATTCISLGAASSVSAGQISVINPSSGMEAAGVVVVISIPQVSAVAGSPATASLSNGLSSSDRAGVGARSELSISQFLAGVDVNAFTADQKRELVILIEALLLDPNLSSYKRSLFEEQLGRF
tara:strand:- start:536 stop:928 length:393 start_codon:yes stop_codon:yes gene_type:complete